MKVVLSAGIVLLIVVVGLGAYLLGHDRANSSTQEQTSSQDTKTVGAKATTLADLPIADLPTTAGVTTYSPNPALLLPATFTVSGPVATVSQLAAYRSAGEVILAPKGWTGTGSVGANGNISIGLEAPSEPSAGGQGISVYLASPRTLNAVFPAGPYNSWVRDHWQDLVGSTEPLPTPATGVTDQTPHVVKYTLQEAGGLMKHGATFSDVQDYYGHGSFDQIEVTLPADQDDLANTIIDNFISETMWTREPRSTLQ